MEFASVCGIIPGDSFSRRHPSLPQARTELVLHAPLKANLGIPGQGAQAWLLAHLWWSSRSLVAALRHCCFLFFFFYPGSNAKPLWYNPQSFPLYVSLSRIHLQCRRPRFKSWVQKISWRRKWQPTCLENPLDRGAWRAIVHGVTGVGHNLASKPPQNLWPQKGESSVTDQEPMPQRPQRAPELSPREKENASQSKHVTCQTIPRWPTSDIPSGWLIWRAVSTQPSTIHS